MFESQDDEKESKDKLHGDIKQLGEFLAEYNNRIEKVNKKLNSTIAEVYKRYEDYTK